MSEVDEGGSGNGERDVRYGHDLRKVQDENGVDLLLLQQNLTLSVEERLLALEDFLRFADEVHTSEREEL